MGIAVFSENSTLLVHAADMWRQRTPAYFYNVADGDWVRASSVFVWAGHASSVSSIIRVGSWAVSNGHG